MPMSPPGLPSWAGLSRSNSFELGASDASSGGPQSPRGSADHVTPILQGVMHGTNGAEPIFGTSAGSGFSAATAAEAML